MGLLIPEVVDKGKVLVSFFHFLKCLIYTVFFKIKIRLKHQVTFD